MKVRSAPWGWALVTLGLCGSAAAQSDPRLRWRTLETEHFQIHFHQGLDQVAWKTARVAEAVFARLTPALGWEPTEVTHIVLSDTTDIANGVASVVPYNAIHLFVTAPSDLSPLGDYDDWLTELVTHELTHVLQIDHIWGLPAVVNAIFGKTLAPNQFYPRWFLEGLAVAEESHRTGAGRLRSTMFDMWMRMEVLEGRFLDLARITDDARRFPHGNLHYLYGSRFLGYVTERFGEEAIRKIIADSGRQLVPYAINRILKRATGHTYPELYRDFGRHLERRYRGQVRAIRARGETPFVFATSGVETALSPRFSPDGRFIYFQLSDNHQRAAIARVRAEGGPVESADLERLFWVNGDMANASLSMAFEPGGTALVYNHIIPWRDVYAWSDLMRWDAATGEQRRLTRGLRAQSPDVARDGRIAFTINRAGTSHVVVADRDAAGARVVHRSPRFDQAYTPRWSPDGRRLAFSVWSAGGYRDIRILDLASGRSIAVTHDRSLDLDPAWSHDGRWLYFSSDRTGVANIHGYELETGRIAQVTNVISGAYQPDVSPDGRSIVFVAYRAGGFDLATMPLDPSRFLEAVPPPEDRPETEIVPAPTVRGRVSGYDALPTLRPYTWSVGTLQNAFGHRTLELSTSGTDVIGLHSFLAIAQVDPTRRDVEYSLSYGYRGSNPALRVDHSRRLTPRRNFRLDGVGHDWVEEALDFGVGTSYTRNRNFQDHTLSVSYDVTHLRAVDAPRPVWDPSGHPPRPPQTGWVSSIGLGWTYSSSFRPTYGVSPERGRQLSISTRIAVPQIGSDYFFLESRYAYNEYLAMPWLRHHVLALRAAGGIGASDFARRGVFTLAGFLPMDLVDSVANDLRAPSVVLRGFLPYSRSGDQFHLYNAEYRLPLLDVDRGVITYPVYLNRIWTAAFADWGDAFDGEIDPADWNLGVGAEILVQMVFGYFVSATFRLGVAHGVTERGITDYYLVVGDPF